MVSVSSINLSWGGVGVEVREVREGGEEEAV